MNLQAKSIEGLQSGLTPIITGRLLLEGNDLSRQEVVDLCYRSNHEQGRPCY